MHSRYLSLFRDVTTIFINDLYDINSNSPIIKASFIATLLVDGAVDRGLSAAARALHEPAEQVVEGPRGAEVALAKVAADRRADHARVEAVRRYVAYAVLLGRDNPLIQFYSILNLWPKAYRRYPAWTERGYKISKKYPPTIDDSTYCNM